MIKNHNDIVTQSISKMEWIIKEFASEAYKLDEGGKLTINSIEKPIAKTVMEMIKLILFMAGAFLSNIVTNKTEMYCKCGKRMTLTKKNSLTKILSFFGYIPVTRDVYFCRRCHKGYGILDKELEIYGEHRITKKMTETISYIAQLVPSFERASEALKKLMNIEASATQIRIVSEEVGRKMFEKDMKEAKKAYERPEEEAEQEVSRKRKDGILYILADGSQVNTRIEDEKGSTWKEMKLGLVFKDSDVIKRGDESHIITKKEYVSYFGSVEQFNKLLFKAAVKGGYGKIKETVIIGDGAPWVSNLCQEVFHDAESILDFYHLSKNVNEYGKYIYPEDEIKRKAWIKEVLDGVTKGRVNEAIKLVEEKKVDETPGNIVNLWTYITNNANRINYKEYKKKGYYIGSGSIESGNKMVIQQRMKQAGMRWSIAGGQEIAVLRTKYESGLWDEIIDIINAA